MKQERRAPTVGLVDSPEFDLHECLPGHPEHPARLSAIRQALRRAQLTALLEHAEPQPVNRGLLERVHQVDYIEHVEDLSASGGGSLDEETIVGPHTFRAALLAAGAVTLAVTRVLDGRWSRAFCSVRPPGHHARRDGGMGFCIFNNIAVGAHAALDRVGRVAILDWDAHHGNGTQAAFARDARVLYASWHQSPLYPDTGLAGDVGEGPGLGAVVNCPLPAGAGDAELLDAWAERVEPSLRAFRPDVLLISAGFDADFRDPLSDLTVTTAGFEGLSRTVTGWADTHCGGRIVSVLEGGYDLHALGEDVVAHVRALMQRT